MVDYLDRPLIGYLPQYLTDIRELKELLATEQIEIFKLFEELNALLNNQFVRTANENGVRRWEKILGIAPRASLTLDERKFTILSKLNEQLPFSIRRLREMLTQLCGEDGYEITLQADIYEIDVKVALTARNNYIDVENMLHTVVPANMVISVSLKYNRHQTLQPYTHAQLAAYTHDQLRNEVIS